MGFDSLLDKTKTGKWWNIDPEWFMLILGPRRLSTVVNNLTQIQQTMFKYWCTFAIFDFGTPAEIYAVRDGA